MAKYLRASDAAISIPISDQRSTSVLEAFAACPRVILSKLAVTEELAGDGYRFIFLPGDDGAAVTVARPARKLI